MPNETPHARELGAFCIMRILLAFTLTIAVAIPALAEAFEPGTLRAGVAVRDITPDPLLPVTGGIGIPNPATEQKGDLTVRALVIGNDEAMTAFASVDVIGFPRVLGDRVRDRVTGIPREAILIGCTHTHSAPDVYSFVMPDGTHTADPDWVEFVVDQLTAALQEARDSMEPVGVRINTDELQGQIAFNYYAPQLYDPRGSVLQFVRPDGTNLATLLNYASHPEVLGNNQGILSPDFCGPFYDRIEAQGGGIGIYMNGANGGMITADNRGEDGRSIRTWEECIRIGELMADETLRIAAEAPVQTSPAIYTAEVEVLIPCDNENFRYLIGGSPLGYELDEDFNAATLINLVNIGNAQIVTIPGEAMANIGYYLKRNMNGEHNLLFGLTQDAFGYIITKEDYDSFRRYEYITRTSMGEGTADIVMSTALSLVEDAPEPVASE